MSSDGRWPSTGIHRAQSGVDHRKTRVTLDHDNFLSKEWPEPLDDFQPFLLGIIDGARSSLEDPWVRRQVEVGFKSAITKVLRDPSLGEIFDGGILAAQRIVQRMTDAGLLLTTAERDRAHAAGKVLMELSGHKTVFLAALRSAAVEIEGSSAGTRPAQLAGGFPER